MVSRWSGLEVVVEGYLIGIFEPSDSRSAGQEGNGPGLQTTCPVFHAAILKENAYNRMQETAAVSRGSVCGVALGQAALDLDAKWGPGQPIRGGDGGQDWSRDYADRGNGS